jgi:hypothetical protein
MVIPRVTPRAYVTSSQTLSLFCLYDTFYCNICYLCIGVKYVRGATIFQYYDESNHLLNEFSAANANNNGNQG